MIDTAIAANLLIITIQAGGTPAAVELHSTTVIRIVIEAEEGATVHMGSRPAAAAAVGEKTTGRLKVLRPTLLRQVVVEA